MNRVPARVGLLNNGAEETKGPETHKAAHALMAKNPHLNFVGNIEGREVLNDHVDVLVADGFSGNIALKSVEGAASFMNKMMKDMFMTNLKTKIAALLLKDQLKAFKAKMDYRYYGGGVVMGVNKGVIKAHGASDALAYKNAIRQAKLCAEFDVPGIVAEKLVSLEVEE